MTTTQNFPPGTLPESLQRVVDEAEIRNLIARFSQYADDRRSDEYLDLFAEDATFEIIGRSRENNLAEIREATRARMEARAKGPQGRHMVSGTIVQVEGDTARARSYFAFVTRADDRPVLGSTGVYEDTFVRTPRGWKYRSRKVTVDSNS